MIYVLLQSENMHVRLRADSKFTSQFIHMLKGVRAVSAEQCQMGDEATKGEARACEAGI